MDGKTIIYLTFALVGIIFGVGGFFGGYKVSEKQNEKTHKELDAKITHIDEVKQSTRVCDERHNTYDEKITTIHTKVNSIEKKVDEIGGDVKNLLTVSGGNGAKK